MCHTKIYELFLKTHESFKVLELEDAVSQMKIIHVAGTKGKVHTLQRFIMSIGH